MSQQETGILFIEVCVKECRPDGRIAIILPNGYLGNRSLKYKIVRDWILRHTRLAAIVSLPRFTFKSSGADVSASVLYLEKRSIPPIEGWSISIDNIYIDPDLTMDPKRYGEKVVKLRNALLGEPHLLLGDIVDFIPEKQSSQGKTVSISKSERYHYIEIQDIGFGDYHSKEIRGWELPSRAKHFSEVDDIYIGAIWGSSVKWCYIPQGATNVVVTNGCFRCRVKSGMEKYTADLLAYLNSEGWGVQTRSFARGSDGLAEICEDDAKKVIIPLLTDTMRESLSKYVQNLQHGTTTLNTVIKPLIKGKDIDYQDPQKRPSHIVLV